MATRRYRLNPVPGPATIKPGVLEDGSSVFVLTGKFFGPRGGIRPIRRICSTQEEAEELKYVIDLFVDVIRKVRESRMWPEIPFEIPKRKAQKCKR
jgi:hypothetical protein